MSILFTVLVILVIGAIAVVASGRGAAMAEEYDDRPDVRLPDEGPLHGDDLRAVRFTTALRGYRASEVDALLVRMARELDAARGEHSAPDARGAGEVPAPTAGRPRPTASEEGRRGPDIETPAPQRSPYETPPQP